MKNIVIDRVKSRLAEISTDESVIDEIDYDDDLFELGIIDSLKFLMLVTFVNSEFDVLSKAENLDINDFRTIRNIHEYVTRNVREAS